MPFLTSSTKSAVLREPKLAIKGTSSSGKIRSSETQHHKVEPILSRRAYTECQILPTKMECRHPETTREVRFSSIIKRTHQRPMKLRLTQNFKLVTCQGLHAGKKTSVAMCSPEGYTTKDKPATEFESAGFCQGKNVQV